MLYGSSQKNLRILTVDFFYKIDKIIKEWLNHIIN